MLKFLKPHQLKRYINNDFICRTVSFQKFQDERDFYNFDKSNKDYNYQYKFSIENPDLFWESAAKNLYWHSMWHTTLDQSKSPFIKWFVGGKFNMCYNTLDVHCEQGFSNQPALIYDSPMTQRVKTLSYGELLTQVSALAGYLKRCGVEPGDRILIYMPMIPQAVIGMLASARIGAIHSLVFGGFGAKELSVRIKHANPKVILTATYGIEPSHIVPYKPIMDQAIKLSQHPPVKCLIFQRKDPPKDKHQVEGIEKNVFNNKFDADWATEVSGHPPIDCIPLPGEHPLYILYTSGTTGDPKGIVRPSAGYAVGLKWSMEHIYNSRPGSVYWSASDLGWVVGHSYACYGPLLNRNTTLIYEGKPISTPDAGAYFRICVQHDVENMFTAPTALRAIRREDPDAIHGKKYKLSKLKGIFLAGEHCDYETLEWTRDKFGVPVIDHWWQTELGWPVTSCCMGLQDPQVRNPETGEIIIPRGSTGKAVPGWNVQITNTPPLSKTASEFETTLTSQNNNKHKNHPENVVNTSPSSEKTDEFGDNLGRILIKQPLPPGFMSTLWRADDRYQDLYFSNYPGYYDTYDAGSMDSSQMISVMSRFDDVINVAGHRLSTGAIEEAILENKDLAECAVVPIPDSLKGQLPLAICVPKHGVTKSDKQISDDTIRIVRDVMGPVVSLKLVCIVPKLAKTRSGKTSRHTMAALAMDKPFDIPVTIDDPKVYNAIRDKLQLLGYAKKNTTNY